MYYKKVSVTERLPEQGKFVTTIDQANEQRVYRLTEHGWNMRDADGLNSPNNNLQITHWLEEVKMPDASIDFEIACRPLIAYLCENHHPHVSVIVTPTNAELLEGLKSTGKILDYIKD